MKAIPGTLDSEIIDSGQMTTTGKAIVLLRIASCGYYNCKNLAKASSAVLSALKNLASFENKNHRIVDGGTVSGKTSEDLYKNISATVKRYTDLGLTVLLLGGSSDMIKGQCGGITGDDFTFVNSSLSMQSFDEVLPLRGRLRYTIVGYQTHYPANSASSVRKAIRLGDSRANMPDNEVFFRDADNGAVSMNAIRNSDVQDALHRSPSGYTGEEICQICYYAGLGAKLKTFAIYDLNSSDSDSVGVLQAAQMAWYFIEGVMDRFVENPLTCSNFKKYIVTTTKGEKIFYQSTLTGRWWMEETESGTKVAVPCTASEYESAGKN